MVHICRETQYTHILNYKFQFNSHSLNALLGGTMLFSQFPNGEKWMCFDGQLFNEPCIVFAFDPTMNVKNHDRSDLIHFYNLGLSNQSSTIMIGNVSSEVERYENILKNA
ncbi:hypothetical protein Avbf_06695 [Armadillidium vulgare]|nr:hypothetical protein Avbf_06695 [Armadillidium vulgare]